MAVLLRNVMMFQYLEVGQHETEIYVEAVNIHKVIKVIYCSIKQRSNQKFVGITR